MSIGGDLYLLIYINSYKNDNVAIRTLFTAVGCGSLLIREFYSNAKSPRLLRKNSSFIFHFKDKTDFPANRAYNSQSIINKIRPRTNKATDPQNCRQYLQAKKRTRGIQSSWLHSRFNFLQDKIIFSVVLRTKRTCIVGHVKIVFIKHSEMQLVRIWMRHNFNRN